MAASLLGRICGVNDGCVFRLVIDNKVSIVVAAPLPCSLLVCYYDLLEACVHIGIDWICILRDIADWRVVSLIIWSVTSEGTDSGN